MFIVNEVCWIYLLNSYIIKNFSISEISRGDSKILMEIFMKYFCVTDDGNGLRPLQTIGYDEKAEVDGADKCDEHKMVLLSPIINCVVNDATSTFE